MKYCYLSPWSHCLLPYQAVSRRVWIQLDKENGGPISNDIIHVLVCCLNMHCKFDGQIHGQINGTLMGSPISGILAESLPEKLEQIALRDALLVLWVNYVNNTFYQRIFLNIQFTMKDVNDHELLFLDVLIILQKARSLVASVHWNATHTKRILPHVQAN